MALASIGVIGCEPAAGSVAGTVIRQGMEERTGGPVYTLAIRTSDGAVKVVREPYAPWHRCPPGSAYPSCTHPPSYRAEGE